MRRANRAGSATGPGLDCAKCSRLVEFRAANSATHPEWHNAPVPAFGEAGARLLIVGLAPGLKGANCTGRPFTGDFAGDLLYSTLHRFGFTLGRYGADAGDGLTLLDCRITNAVRCVPPGNKPIGAEIANCRDFLTNEIAAMTELAAILALGTVAHTAVLAALGITRKDHPFAHGARHLLPTGMMLADSYHCSRYNTNTGRLTEAMFHAVFASMREFLDAPPRPVR